MAKRKSSRSLKKIFANKNLKDRQSLYGDFLLSFPELADYIRNFNHHKKYILLQDATPEDKHAIIEFLGVEAVKQDNYDFLSIRTVDCSTSSYKDIRHMILEDTREDLEQIEIILKKYLLSLINHKQGSYKYPEMEYRIGKGRNTINGMFTEKGLDKLTNLTGNILKEESKHLSKDIYVNVLKELYGLFFEDSSGFVKFKAVGLVNISIANRITFGKIKKNRPDLVIGIAKAGEDTESLQAVYGKQFKIISYERLKTKDGQQENQVVETGVGKKSTLAQSEPQGITKDEIPLGTKWNNIEMFFTDAVKETIDISISGKNPYTKGYWDLELKHIQAKKAVLAWEVLKEFAKSEDNVIPTNKVKFEQIKRLRDALKSSFGIPENPIPHYDKEGYKTLFRIEDKSFTNDHKKSIPEKENIECSECGELIKKPDHNNPDDGGNYICDKCKRTSHDRLSKGDTYNAYPDKDE